MEKKQSGERGVCTCVCEPAGEKDVACRSRTGPASDRKQQLSVTRDVKR